MSQILELSDKKLIITVIKNLVEGVNNFKYRRYRDFHQRPGNYFKNRQVGMLEIKKKKNQQKE